MFAALVADGSSGSVDRRLAFGYVDAALDLVEALPAAAARILAGGDGLRAVRAADARVVLVVELVVGDVVVEDVLPHLRLSPRGERVHLHQPELLVPLDDVGISACGRLVAADAADPRRLAFESPHVRLDL